MSLNLAFLVALGLSPHTHINHHPGLLFSDNSLEFTAKSGNPRTEICLEQLFLQLPQISQCAKISNRRPSNRLARVILILGSMTAATT